MKRFLLLALVVSFALAGAASAATAPATAPFLLSNVACRQAISTPQVAAAPVQTLPTMSLFAPHSQSKLLPLCPGAV